MHWSEAKQPVVLEVTPCSIDQLDAATGAPLASYMYKDIEALVPVSDIPGGLCIQVCSTTFCTFSAKSDDIEVHQSSCIVNILMTFTQRVRSSLGTNTRFVGISSVYDVIYHSRLQTLYDIKDGCLLILEAIDLPS